MDRIKKITDFICTNIFEKFFASWFLASAVGLMFGTGAISLTNTDVLTFVISFFVSFIFVCFADGRAKGAVRVILVFAVLLFSMVLLMHRDDIYTFIALAVFYCISVHHYCSKKEDFTVNLPKKYVITLISLCFVLFFGVVTAISILRYVTYAAPNYDFGIFCNMYYNMKNSFTPFTTCERDTLLSHFAVHFSPALYVFLPVYCIFPSPVTIAVCQTVAIYSGLIPFVLILKNRKIESLTVCLFSVMYMANTAFSMGCSYDFHENCLLAPFILWMIYFYEKNKTPFVFLFALLTLTVKEDAFIYVAVFAAFITVSNKDWKRGVPLAVVAVVYFAFACWYINNYGLGIMEGRFDTMINEDEGLFGIVKTLLFNLSYSVTQIFAVSDNGADKLIYLLELLCPLGLIPFFTKKPSRLILILPVFLNLLTDYSYQYDIKFQYNFGITALMLYACILNISDMDVKKRNLTSAIASGLAVMLFFMCIIPTFTRSVNSYISDKEMYSEIDAVLEGIDEDASVCVSTFFLPHIADRAELYEVHYTKHTDFDYVILDFRPGYNGGSLEFAAKFEALGYVRIDSGSEYVGIYVKAEQ